MKMSKQARKLRVLRAWLGLTEKDVAMKCGTSYLGSYKRNDSRNSGNSSSGNNGNNYKDADSTLYECGRSMDRIVDRSVESADSGLNRDVTCGISCDAIDAVSENYVEKSRAAIARTFTVGSCYQVVSNKSLIKRLKAGEKYVLQSVNATINDMESGYTFRYLGKQGIHHTFREISGGWGRTYTDAQLVGKELVEVSEDEVTALRKSSIMRPLIMQPIFL